MTVAMAIQLRTFPVAPVAPEAVKAVLSYVGTETLKTMPLVELEK